MSDAAAAPGPPPVPVLVLAGSRLGAEDPVARAAGVSLKALAPVAGVPMLERVLAALLGSEGVGALAVCGVPESALSELPLARRLREQGRLTLLPAASSPSLSVAAAMDRLGTPLLVATADHALLTPAMVEHLLRHAPAEADAVAALARSEVVLAAFPGTRRTWLRFREPGGAGRWSGCNLFLLRRPAAGGVVAFWRRVEAERKRPHRMLSLLSPWLLLRHALGLLTLPAALRALGRRTGARLAVVELPFAEAAVDVDSADDLALAGRLLAARGGAP